MSGSGTVETPSDLVFSLIDGRSTTTEAIAATPVRAGGRVLRLGDIANVSRGYQNPPSFMARSNGKVVHLLAVSTAAGGNILNLGHALGRVDGIRLHPHRPLGAAWSSPWPGKRAGTKMMDPLWL